MFGFFREDTRRELYTIVRGSEIYRYTSGDDDVTMGEVVWKKLTIKRSSISSSSDIEKNSLEVTFAADSAFAQSCLRSALEVVVFLTLSKYVNGTASLLWQGRLTSVKPDGATIVLTFDNDYTSLARAGSRYKYQRTCAHDLYGAGCKLNKDDWKVRTTLASVNGNQLLLRGLESYVDNYFRLGMLENKNGVCVGVEASSGNNITLIRRLDSLASQVTTDAQLSVLATKLQALNNAQTSEEIAAAQSDYDAYNATINYVYVYPGCMKSLTACDGFGNTDNHMGFAFIPEKNPTTTRFI